ncbi:MAG TPA: recombination-associated protein RdgC [Paenalcaligenes sp.]|nr:recombination-associated protein RdgC [Paenalcaligenes sp.]
MWFKNLRVFRLHPDWNLSTEQVLQALDTQRFHPLGSQDQNTIGWVAPAEEYGLALEVERQLLLCAQTEKKLLPASVINQFARERAVEIEAEQGYRPGRKQMQEIKEDVTAILLPRAFSVQRRTHVWIDPINRWLVIDAAAQNTADEILALLGETFTPFPAVPVQSQLAPTALMTQWLVESSEPSPFQVEQDAELRSKQDQRAVIRYVRHELDKELIQEQIAQGMYCSRLGLSWADRVEFVLYENLELRRVAPLELLTDEQSQAEYTPEEELSATFLLMCREYHALFADLLVQLGGEQQPQ